MLNAAARYRGARRRAKLRGTRRLPAGWSAESAALAYRNGVRCPGGRAAARRQRSAGPALLGLSDLDAADLGISRGTHRIHHRGRGACPGRTGSRHERAGRHPVRAMRERVRVPSVPRRRSPPGTRPLRPLRRATPGRPACGHGTAGAHARPHPGSSGGGGRGHTSPPPWCRCCWQGRPAARRAARSQAPRFSPSRKPRGRARGPPW